ncbi:MAG: histidinol-phosphatase [Planctomycetes bacterium]|nr:histidinol-phosphatase [Planctomycetota bacterium]
MSSESEIERRLMFARNVALDAAKLILSYYQDANLAVESKRDSSPVTAADRGAEELIRAGLATEFPQDAILGEEFGETPGTSGFRWILDPVDGTKSFIHGVPLFGTLIGVEFEGKCVIGVCHIPALGETAWGARGLGAWWQPAGGSVRAARVSQTEELRDSLFCFTTVQGFERIGRRDAFDALIANSALARGWGDCYGHMLVATGRADLMVDPLTNIWDVAALIPIVEEAGGRFFDWNGQTRPDSGNGISTNPKLAEQILKFTKR